LYTLYYTAPSYTSESTALIPRIALEEIGADYGIIAVELEPTPPDWYLKINPHGKIPTLTMDHGGEDDGNHIYPSPAILLALAEKHQSAGLLPSGAASRAACYRRLFDMVEQLHSGFMQRLFAHRYSTEDAHVEHIQRKSLQWILDYMKAAEFHLGDFHHICSESYTICDIYFYVMMRWYADLEPTGDLSSIGTFPQINDYCHRMERRLAVMRALEADGLNPIAIKQ
jgi:glutathione S-transferase